MTYSVDQYKNDQIMQLQYAQDKESNGINRSYWLKHGTRMIVSLQAG
jgi:hypothetical protein